MSATVPPYTSNQEVFDIAARHLLTQMRRSVVPREGSSIPRCAYRSKDGCACAVGALIPTELYDPEMDTGDSGIDEVTERFPSIAALFENVSLNLLAELQDVHDESSPPTWAHALRMRASSYHLNTAVIDELAPLPDTSAQDAALLQELGQ